MTAMKRRKHRKRKETKRKYLQTCDLKVLDLRKTLDVVNHDLLVVKLQMYGCSSSALLWFKSYLSDPRQCVNIAGTLSDTELYLMPALTYS